MRELFATVAEIAAGQHGRITARQLREVGVDKSCTHRWLADGLLHRVHVGARVPQAPARARPAGAAHEHRSRRRQGRLPLALRARLGGA
jgi:hypothetical protein